MRRLIIALILLLVAALLDSLRRQPRRIGFEEDFVLGI